MVRPRAGDRLKASKQTVAMAANAALYRRGTGVVRAPGVFVAVLTRDAVDACMDSVAERNRLFDIGAGRPWPLRKGQDAKAAHHQERR